MSQSTLIRVNDTLFVNWLMITFVDVATAQTASGDTVSIVRVGTAEGFRDIPMADGGDRLLDHLQSISEDLTVPPPEVNQVPTAEEHTRSFADRFVRPST